MRRPISLVALALLIGVVLPGTAVAAVGGSDLPLQGTHSGFCTTNLTNGQEHCLTTGVISHFGLTTMDQNIQHTGPTSWLGTWTITAASGDELSGTASGTFGTTDGIHFTVVGLWVSTSGTGRLADASVTFNATAQALFSIEGNIATGAMEVAVVGRLSY